MLYTWGTLVCIYMGIGMWGLCRDFLQEGFRSS